MSQLPAQYIRLKSITKQADKLCFVSLQKGSEKSFRKLGKEREMGQQRPTSTDTTRKSQTDPVKGQEESDSLRLPSVDYIKQTN